jgi:hypothetical protein
MMDPRYRGFVSSQIPEATEANGTRIKVIAGAVDGVKGPVSDVVTAPEYLDVTVPAGATFTRPTSRGHTVLAYVIGGKAVFCHQSDPYSYDAEGGNYFDMERSPLLGDGHMVLFDDGDSVTIRAGDEPVRFLLISGKPIKEPVAWYGPIVMNTQEELRIAYEELQKGTFVKVRGSGG